MREYCVCWTAGLPGCWAAGCVCQVVVTSQDFTQATATGHSLGDIPEFNELAPKGKQTVHIYVDMCGYSPRHVDML